MSTASTVLERIAVEAAPVSAAAADVQQPAQGWKGCSRCNCSEYGGYIGVYGPCPKKISLYEDIYCGHEFEAHND